MSHDDIVPLVETLRDIHATLVVMALVISLSTICLVIAIVSRRRS